MVGVSEESLVEPRCPLMLLISVISRVYGKILACCCPVYVPMRLLSWFSVLGASLFSEGRGLFNWFGTGLSGLHPQIAYFTLAVTWSLWSPTTLRRLSSEDFNVGLAQSSFILALTFCRLSICWPTLGPSIDVIRRYTWLPTSRPILLGLPSFRTLSLFWLTWENRSHNVLLSSKGFPTANMQLSSEVFILLLQQMIDFNQLLKIPLIYISLLLAHVVKKLLILSAELLQLSIILTGLILCQLPTPLPGVALAELQLKLEFFDLGFKLEVSLLWGIKLGLQFKDLGCLHCFPFTALRLVMRLNVLKLLSEAVLKALYLLFKRADLIFLIRMSSASVAGSTALRASVWTETFFISQLFSQKFDLSSKHSYLILSSWFPVLSRTVNEWALDQI